MSRSLESPQTGLRHSTGSPVALAAVDRLQQELLRYGLDAGVIHQAIDADPDFAAAHALAAALHLFAMSREGAAQAARHLAAATRLAAHANRREQILIAAISAWAGGDIARARALHAAIATDWPRDLLSARIAQFHQLNGGDFAAMRRMTARLLPANPDVSHLWGMHAFALEQTGDAAAAERLGRAAADRDFDPWAEHAVAHAMERPGRAAEAIAWLAPRSARWSRCSSFLYTHNWWHLALLHLEQGDTGAALALYDRRVWGVRKAYCQDQANAVSLLARLSLAGVDVGPRWAELAHWLRPRWDERISDFLDLHYIYGLARAGADAEVDAMLAGLAARTRAPSATPAHRLTARAATGLVAHARGDCRRAAALLAPVLPALHQLGGSSTQRDLFCLIHLDALTAAAPDEARLRLALRTRDRGPGAWSSLFQRRLRCAAA